MASVLVSNISNLLDKNHLKELFEVCGPIMKMEFSQDTTDRECLIEFAKEEHAQAAQLLSGTPLGDRKLTVTKGGRFTVSLASFAAQTPEAILAPVFAPLIHTPLVSPLNQTLMGSSFTYTSPSTLPAPLLEASKRRADEVARTIYVGNLSNNVTETQLRQFFSAYWTDLLCQDSRRESGFTFSIFVY